MCKKGDVLGLFILLLIDGYIVVTETVDRRHIKLAPLEQSYFTVLIKKTLNYKKV